MAASPARSAISKLAQQSVRDAFVGNTVLEFARAAAAAVTKQWRSTPVHRSGIGVERSTGTAVRLFLGEPSITRSE